MFKTQIDKDRFDLDSRWDANLKDCFKLVVNNEYYLLKLFAADVSVIVQ